MLLSNNECNRIIISSDLIDNFIGDADFYDSLELTGTYNGTDVVYEFDTAIGNCETTDDVRTCNSIVYLYPSLFGQTDTLESGIYTVSIKGIAGTQLTTKTACVFVDCTMICDVIESDCLEAMMLHYTLSQANICNCNCDKLPTIFDRLQSLLDEKCGC